MKDNEKIEHSRDLLKLSRRVVIKFGSAVLTTGGIELNSEHINRLAAQITQIRQQREVVVVSSGAMAAGFAKLGLQNEQQRASLPLKQAAAAVGQSSLMGVYEDAFAQYGIHVAQVLLTAEDLANRHRFLNARGTVAELLALEVLPIINENDTVAVAEIKFGDNDNLATMVSHLVGADLLIILSDIDGLYSADPKRNAKAHLLSIVDRVSSDIEKNATGTTGVGTGGMQSKILAARKAMARGIPVIIANGKRENVINEIFSGADIGTLFIPQDKPLHSRKHWIAHIAATRGTITLDAGAVTALTKSKKSLLPGGIVSVNGHFKLGDCINCVDPEGKCFARGLTRYTASELERIKGLRTSQIVSVLGYKDYDEVIHRDDLVLLADE
ncbi:MAG: glutamate 5-kinase [Deltaproteobacteria bacterium]|nr:glutamate 5-kinase [Deltaproteobacteria bacterium]